MDARYIGPFALVSALSLALPGCATLRRPVEPSAAAVRDARLLDPALPRLRIEVDAVEGSLPRPAALAGFARALAFHVDKPGGIEVVQDERLPPSEWAPDAAALADLVRRHRSLPGRSDTADLYVVYGPRWGRYRGICWRAGQLAPDLDVPVVVVLAGSHRPILWLTGTTQERAVLVHEAGHALGLVTQAGHGARGHCVNAWCAMYAGVDARSALVWTLPVLLAGQLPLHYCRQCRADLWPAGVPPGLRDVPGMPTRDRPGCDPVFPGSASPPTPLGVP